MKKGVNIKIKKRLFSIAIIGIMLFSILAINLVNFNNVSAALPVSEIKYDASNNASVFPDSYKGYITALKQAHPNWIIKAFYTNLDWNSVINSESSGTYSRVQNSAYPDAWKRLESSNDANYNAAGYVLASKAAVAYTMDPRNFLNDQGIFQFRVVDQNVSSDNIKSVNETMTYTPMKDTDYDDIITRVGQALGVSPLFIVSRIRQETSCDIINNTSINGKHSSHPGYYNFFNIGAYDSASSSVQYGINLAYSKGWNTPEKGITGGVEWLKNNYIKYGQNTVYFQKFDVANPYGNAVALLSYQYMSNINAPASEAKIAYDGLSRAGKLDNTYTFYIPIYNNMPETASVYPGQVAQDYVDDNTRFYVAESVAPDKLYVRSGPGTGYSIVAKLDALDQMTRIKRSLNTQWDMIRLDNGITGYVFREYIKEYPMVTSLSLKETSISMKLNETHKLEYTIGPDNAKNKEVEWSSSNSNIVSVDGNGILTARSGGEVTITLKAKETGITATCKVIVEANVESISLPKDTYTLVKGKYLTITPIIKPDSAQNKEYTIKSNDENVVKVENLKLIGVNEGETFVTFTTKDQNKTVTAKIKVIDVSQSDIINFVEDIKVDGQSNTISKIEPNYKVSDILSKFDFNDEKYEVVIANNKGNEIQNGELIGTGTTINLVTKDTNDIIETYTVLIYGDVSGDGEISPSDYVKIKNSILGTEKLEGIYKTAGDVNKDGEISPSDYVKIKNKILGTENITQ